MAESAADLSEEIDGTGDRTITGVYMVIDKTKIPMTDAELEAVTTRLERYVESHGVVFGFVGDLLGN